MDLNNFDTTKAATEGADLHLCDPKGRLAFDEESKEPVTITLIGRDAKEYQKNQAGVSDKRLNIGMSGGRMQIDTEALQEESLTLLVKATKGWKHIRLGGEELEFTPTNVRMVYERFPWIREQVDEFVGKRSNFLGNS